MLAHFPPDAEHCGEANYSKPAWKLPDRKTEASNCLQSIADMTNGVCEQLWINNYKRVPQMDCSQRHLRIASSMSISHVELRGWTVSFSSLGTPSRRTHRTYSGNCIVSIHRPSGGRAGCVFITTVTQASNQVQQRVKAKINLSCTRYDELSAS